MFNKNFVVCHVTKNYAKIAPAPQKKKQQHVFIDLTSSSDDLNDFVRAAPSPSVPRPASPSLTSPPPAKPALPSAPALLFRPSKHLVLDLLSSDDEAAEPAPAPAKVSGLDIRHWYPESEQRSRLIAPLVPVPKITVFAPAEPLITLDLNAMDDVEFSLSAATEDYAADDPMQIETDPLPEPERSVLPAPKSKARRKLNFDEQAHSLDSVFDSPVKAHDSALFKSSANAIDDLLLEINARATSDVLFDELFQRSSLAQLAAMEPLYQPGLFDHVDAATVPGVELYAQEELDAAPAEPSMALNEPAKVARLDQEPEAPAPKPRGQPLNTDEKRKKPKAAQPAQRKSTRATQGQGPKRLGF